MLNRRSFICLMTTLPVLATPALAASPDIFAVDGLAIRGTDPVAAPQYGGYCAYAASKGAIAMTVPEAWTIYDDKLYLNYSESVRDIWRRDIPGNILLADGNWPDILTR